MALISTTKSVTRAIWLTLSPTLAVKQKKKIAPISSMHTTTPYAIPTMC